MAEFRLCAFSDEADRALEGQISALSRNGVSRMEIRGVDGKNVADIDVAAAREIKKRLDGNGIEVFSIGSPIGKIGIKDPLQPEIDRLSRLIETARVLGAEKMRIFSFYIPKGEAADPYFDEVGERLLRFTEAAEGSGIILCHENEKGIFGDTATRCLKLLDALPKIKGVYDPANFMQCGEEPIAAYGLLASYHEYIHIKDAARDGSIHPAGYGDCRIEELLTACAKNGHLCLTAEPHLKIFAGLAALENDSAEDLSRKYSRGFKTNGEAFYVAIRSLKTVIEKTGNTYR